MHGLCQEFSDIRADSSNEGAKIQISGGYSLYPSPGATPVYMVMYHLIIS